MLDPLDNLEIAAASKVCGGRFGQDGRNQLQSAPFHQPASESVRPALHTAGAYVFLRPVINLRPPFGWALNRGRPHLPPPPRRSGHLAGCRTVAT